MRLSNSTYLIPKIGVGLHVAHDKILLIIDVSATEVLSQERIQTNVLILGFKGPTFQQAMSYLSIKYSVAVDFVLSN